MINPCKFLTKPFINTWIQKSNATTLDMINNLETFKQTLRNFERNIERRIEGGDMVATLGASVYGSVVGIALCCLGRKAGGTVLGKSLAVTGIINVGSALALTVMKTYELIVQRRKETKEEETKEEDKLRKLIDYHFSDEALELDKLRDIDDPI